jgi:hypothetical protein
MTHEYIQVERYVREYLKGVPNAYCLVYFACCRQIKELSEKDIFELYKKIEDKLVNEFEETKDQIL